MFDDIAQTMIEREYEESAFSWPPDTKNIGLQTSLSRMFHREIYRYFDSALRIFAD